MNELYPWHWVKATISLILAWWMIGRMGLNPHSIQKYVLHIWPIPYTLVPLIFFLRKIIWDNEAWYMCYNVLVWVFNIFFPCHLFETLFSYHVFLEMINSILKLVFKKNEILFYFTILLRVLSMVKIQYPLSLLVGRKKTPSVLFHLLSLVTP